MAIIIGDIHGDLGKAKAFLAYKPEVDHIVLGDYVDSCSAEITAVQELSCLDLLIDSEAVLLWGNHDLAYLSPSLWTIDHRFPAIQQDLCERYESAHAAGRFKAAYAADGWVCTHAGASTSLTAASSNIPWETGEASAIADALNAEFIRELSAGITGPLFYRGQVRGGSDHYGGIFWYDGRWEPSSPPDPRLRQIFGHTLTEGPMRKATWININIEDGYWIFDTETDGFALLRGAE